MAALGRTDDAAPGSAGNPGGGALTELLLLTPKPGGRERGATTCCNPRQVAVKICASLLDGRRRGRSDMYK